MTLNSLFTIGAGDIAWAVVLFFSALFLASYARQFRSTSGEQMIVARFAGSLRWMGAMLTSIWKSFVSFMVILLIAFGVTDGTLIAAIPLIATFEPLAWASLGVTSMGILEVLGIADIRFMDAIFMTAGIIAVAFLVHAALETLYEVYIER